MKISPTELRHKALQRQSKTRLEALFLIILGIVLCVWFAFWAFATAHAVLERIGWGLLSLWCVCFAYQGYKQIWPRNLPQDAPISTCLEFYRRELERRLDHLRHGLRRLGLPFFFLGLALIIVGTGALNARLHALLNAIPLIVLFAVWAVLYFSMKKKETETLQQEIEELRTFERSNR